MLTLRGDIFLNEAILMNNHKIGVGAKIITFNPGPAEPGYALKKPTDLDLHYLSLSMGICINNLNKVIWLAENHKWVWYFNLFSTASVNLNNLGIFRMLSFYMWAVPFGHNCEHRRPRSACASMHSNQDLHCLLKESLATIECINGELRQDCGIIKFNYLSTDK